MRRSYAEHRGPLSPTARDELRGKMHRMVGAECLVPRPGAGFPKYVKLIVGEGSEVVTSTRKFYYRLCTGQVLDAGTTVIPSCGTKSCMNPDHMVLALATSPVPLDFPMDREIYGTSVKGVFIVDGASGIAGRGRSKMFGPLPKELSDYRTLLKFAEEFKKNEDSACARYQVPLSVGRALVYGGVYDDELAAARRRVDEARATLKQAKEELREKVRSARAGALGRDADSDPDVDAWIRSVS